MAIVEIEMDTSVSKSNSTTLTIAPDDDDISISSITPTIRKTKVYVFAVLVLGIAGSICFTLFGIRNAQDEAEDFFERRANDLVHVIENTFREYETAALSIHNVCRRDRNTSRIDFREFYEYLTADGLEMQAAQCIPNVTHEERPEWEARSRAFYAEYYPEIEYDGFTGFEYDPVTDNPVAFTPHRSEAPFYWPVYYTEPVLPNAAAIGLDLYSWPSQKNEIDLAVTSRETVLGGRLKVVQEVDDNAYSILIYHPGIYLETRPDPYPKDLGVILVRVPSLLARVAALQEESLACYVYDTTVFNTGGSTDFLGAAEYYVQRDRETGRRDTRIVFPEETEIEDVYAMSDTFLHEATIPIAHGTWKIVVVPVNGVYDSKYGFVLFGGFMIFASAIGLSAFMLSNLQKVYHIHHAKAKAETERNIVSSLFPENVIQRLMDDAEAKKNALKERKKHKNAFRSTEGSDKYVTRQRELTSEALFGSKPIAEFHSSVTILCADLTGFTPWASVREPSQVLTLLEVLFHSFDKIAARRCVFKVETVGDCYVAASGLPQPNRRHANIMAKFANDIMTKFRLVVRELETTLGPGDLDLRIGLHSGAVTSGVLRGDKGRFQLFGNTFNIAQKIERSGVRGKIHVSPDTRELLVKDGKGDWLVPSNQTVFIRGKGDLQTYFLQIVAKARSSSSVGSSGSLRASKTNKVETMTVDERLVSWNVTELTRLLKPVMARRQAKKKYLRSTKDQECYIPTPQAKKTIPLEEVKEVIALPKFDEHAFMMQFHAEDIELDPMVESQLTKLVTEISHMYRKNPFHCFEHACHVAMSITKMLSRIHNPKQVLMEQQQEKQDKGKTFQIASEISDFTFGITSDPLTQFAAFMAALIHDADHPGIPNMALINEDPVLATMYKNTSVAEQNSIDLFWDAFLRNEYKELRECICGDANELEHFRELILVMVLSTDIMDKELNQKRKDRWNTVFAEQPSSCPISDDEMRNRKATIVIEHLIQASDVSHTMQHWNVFRKWNERLFMELYHAYKEGRLDKDPSLGWYEGEKGFLDFYVLPLAKKLDTCGVFGVSSDEFAFYASENRKEWEIYGQEMVQEYIRKYNETYARGLYEIDEDFTGTGTSTMGDSGRYDDATSPVSFEGHAVEC